MRNSSFGHKLKTGTIALSDDIITASETQDELFNCLFSVFEQIQKYDFHV